MTLALRDQQHLTEHYASVARKAERGRMPKTLDGLLRWYTLRLAEELPERLHKAEVWRDAVTKGEREQGIYPTGGSHLGTLAWSGLFRLVIEGNATELDEDGYYLFPIRSALSRLNRRRPLTVRYLVRLGMTKGDWRSAADDLGYAHEFAELFTTAALVALWKETYDAKQR